MARIKLENIEKVNIVKSDNGDFELYDDAQLLIGDCTHRYIQLKRNGLYGIVDINNSMLVVPCNYKEMRFFSIRKKRFIQAQKDNKLWGFIPWFPQTDMISL